MGSAGLQTTALMFGGGLSSGPTGATFSFNGTSWTAQNSMSTARRGLGSGGTQTSALASGGAPTGVTAGSATEEWTGAALATKTITTS